MSEENKKLVLKLEADLTDISKFYGIYLGNNRIGKIELSFYDNQKALGISDLMIDEEYRNQGFGEYIIKGLVLIYKKNYNIIYCYVDTGNKSAIRFFKKVGHVYDKNPKDHLYYVELYNKYVRAIKTQTPTDNAIISLTSLYKEGDSEYFDIYLGEKPIGKIALTYYEDIKALLISNFEIYENNRDRGYGTKTILYIVNKYKDKYNTIYCFVDKDNTKAIKLYNKLGHVFTNMKNNYDEYYVEFYKNKEKVEEQFICLHGNRLLEDSRALLLAKSRTAGPYKGDKTRGKNRFERKKYSRISNAVKEYNQIDMNKLFKSDMLEVSIPVTGETDNYTVTIRMDGVVAEIQRNIKSNGNKLEYRTIIQSLTKVFNTSNIYVKCTCPDYKFTYKHNLIINNNSVDDTAQDPGPGKGIRNPKDDKGKGCKHILLVLANGDWMMKVASVIKNYIFYAEEHITKGFMKIIFPKLYGVDPEDAQKSGILPPDADLNSDPKLIELANDWAKNRGKFKTGSNRNDAIGHGAMYFPNKQDKTKDSKNNTTADKKKAA